MSRRALLLLVSLLASACASLIVMRPTADEWEPAPGPARLAKAPRPVPCANATPLRQAFFGDLHVHTRYSMDARSRGMLGTPDDAYRFARGGTIGLGPFDASGQGTRPTRLDRPLDFAAVTDHAEWMGEVALCTAPDSPVFARDDCRRYRGELPARPLVPGLTKPGRMASLVGFGGRRAQICGGDDARCRAALEGVWQATRRATERWNDTSEACAFTTFHGWEHSYSPNLSNGRLFEIGWRREDRAEQVRRASVRARMDRLVEMMQVKGESECRNGLFEVAGGEDELCDFEKIRALAESPPDDCREGAGWGAMQGGGCQSRVDFARYALVAGMREAERIGVNPFRFGLVGSTDGHNAAPGDVEEHDWPGCCANLDATPEARLSTEPAFAGAGNVARNPGGLMGVWAEENRRDALYDAMQRREAFATSGPRLAPRFFGAWSLAPDLCERADLVETGYAEGVPMGGVLDPPAQSGAVPVFVAHVDRDPGTLERPGGRLDRLQIVKVWDGEDGRFHQAVHDVAGRVADHPDEPDAPPGVDLATCEPEGRGADSLCAVWRDPDFDPAREAAWYVRVVEAPSCRWSWRTCLEWPEADRPEGCRDPRVPRVIQERAWTSPVWYEPEATPAPAS